MKKLITFAVITLLVLVSCKQETFHNISTNVQPEGSGSVVMTPASGSVLEGTSVSFKANPNGDYVFTGWSGDLSGSENPKTVVVSSNLNLTANFVLREYPLSISVEGEGSVSERVISTRTYYSSGTVVELTATPAIGWSFDHWEGDLTGKVNPDQITVSTAKSVKAVFTKNRYAYNLKIVGPGIVDEYLIQDTRASLSYGAKVILKAYPSEGAVFKGWSGDVSGNDMDLEITLERDLDINAIFEQKEAPYYPPVDLNLPSRCYPRIYPHIDIQSVGTIPTWSLQLDYNRDGYIDLFSSPAGYTPEERPDLRFYLGAKDSSLSSDPLNDAKAPGMIGSRKCIYGDYNGDGLPDICIIGGGYDAPPWPGDYPLILMSNPTMEYSLLRFEDCKGVWHGGASGDFDNDGDLDIFMIQAWHGEALFFVNDGAGNFTIKNDLFRQDLKDGMYNCELYDFDKDGYLDLIVGAHDHANSPEGQYKNMPIVFWGNGENYTDVDYSQLTETPVMGMGVVNDFYPYDLDGDGIEELILIRTGDGERNSSIGAYDGWCVQVFHRTGRSFQDVTYQYFDQKDICCTNVEWIAWMEIIREEGIPYLYFHDCDGRLKRMFKLEDKHFVKLKSNAKKSQGICLYSDGNTVFSNSVNLGWKQDAYSGSSCIRYDKWEDWTGYEILFPDTSDFSELEKNGYCLEFFVKNTDPSLVFSLNFQTDVHGDPFPEGHFPTYFHYYWGTEHPSNGEWECIRIPLSEFECADNLDSKYHWDSIKSFFIWAAGYNGQDFLLDEIRIRKVLPE